jgi:hypothetical protein
MDAVVDRTAPAADSYALHAQWQAYHGQSRPFRDLEFLNVKGRGTWVGSNLHVSNSSPAWWGEGDEKVWVDGESFPSTFGTGTEDYYGYAWSSPELFHRPYHSQPRSDGPGNFGHSDVNRCQIFDPIPYRKSLRFNLELWHWADVETTFAYTSYWYAPADSQGPVEINRALLLPPEEAPPTPVKGAIEGEALTATATGGNITVQEGFWQPSGGKQLWWTGPAAGDRLSVPFDAPSAGRYEVFANFCHARDYGIHVMSINGQAGRTIDFFGDGVKWEKVSLVTYDLPAGRSTMTFECKGKRPEAAEGQMFGLDYLLLERR